MACGTYVNPRCEEMCFSIDRPISCRAVEPCLRHSVSSSYHHGRLGSAMLLGVFCCRRSNEMHTAMSRLSSILTTLPKMQIHWYKLAK